MLEERVAPTQAERHQVGLGGRITSWVRLDEQHSTAQCRIVRRVEQNKVE